MPSRCRGRRRRPRVRRPADPEQPAGLGNRVRLLDRADSSPSSTAEWHERPERLGEPGQAPGPLVAGPAVELHLAAVLDDLEAIPSSFGSCSQASPCGIALAVVGMQGRMNFAGTLLKWALHRLKGNAATLRARRRDWHRLGSRRDSAARRAKPTAAAHRSSGRTISSGGPRRSITSRSVFMAQDVGRTSGRRHQPSRLSRCGEARHHELASHTQRRGSWIASG